MLVKFPNKILNEGEEYQLFLDYRKNCNQVWAWLVSYVGDHGILYQDEDKDLDELYERFLQKFVPEYIANDNDSNK